MNEIEMGVTYRDKLSGYEGVATAATRYWAGCDRITLVSSDGTNRQEIFDDLQLERLANAIIPSPNLNGADPTGGDRPVPPPKS